MNTSFPEQAVYFYIKKVFPDAINSYKDIFDNRMELDIYIPSIKVGIEYDGAKWHKDETLYKERTKYHICQKKGIFLYRLKENRAHQVDGLDVADGIIRVQKAPSASNMDYFYLDKAIKSLLYYLFDFDISDTFNHGTINNNYLDAINGAKINTDVDTKRDKKLILENYKVALEHNSLQQLYPDIAMQWHPTLNGDLKPNMFTYGSHYKAHWLCPTCKQTWQAAISLRTGIGRGCPYCAHERPIKGVNDLVTLRPDLMKEWDYEKNKGIAPTNLMPNSNKRVWWKCSKCGYEYRSYICNRNKGNGCKRCAGYVIIPGVNDLETLYPDIAKEWDYELNGDIKPNQIFPKSNKKYHWICSLEHKYEASPNARTRANGCPYCAGNKVLEGFNDVATTHPEIIKGWHPTFNGNLKPTQVSVGYKDKIWFECDQCKKAYDTYLGNRAKGYGKCPYCANRKSKGKLILLEETNQTFTTLKEAAKAMGKKDFSLIQMCCNGRVKTAYGYHFKYILKK